MVLSIVHQRCKTGLTLHCELDDAPVLPEGVDCMAGEESGVLTDCRHDLTNSETNMQGIMGYEPSNSKMQLFILFSILSDADEDSKSF